MTGDISERMLSALVIQLIRVGKLDIDDVFEAAAALEASGDKDASRALNCLPLYAEAKPQSEIEAEWRRRQMIERTAFIAKQSEGYKPDE